MSYVLVIVYRSSQPARLRVSKPDLGLAIISDLACLWIGKCS